MKKTILSLVVGFFVFSAMAQTTLNTAEDFTVTDTKGVTHNLFTYLNAGKFVCIDFFYKDCPPCAATAPYYQTTFEHYGCNQGNVIFIAVSSQDNDATLIAYADSKGYTYPMVNSSAGGGLAVHNLYNVTATPTYILIKPDKSIVEKDIYPVPNAQTFITKITGYGGIAQACVSSVNENTKANIVSYPNPAENSFFVNAPNYQKLQFEMMDVLGKIVYKQEINAQGGLFELNISSLHQGIYLIRCISNSEIIETLKVLKK